MPVEAVFVAEPLAELEALAELVEGGVTQIQSSTEGGILNRLGAARKLNEPNGHKNTQVTRCANI